MESFVYGILRKESDKIINSNNIVIDGIICNRYIIISKKYLTSKIEYLKQLLINEYNVEKLEKVI